MARLLHRVLLAFLRRRQQPEDCIVIFLREIFDLLPRSRSNGLSPCSLRGEYRGNVAEAILAPAGYHYNVYLHSCAEVRQASHTARERDGGKEAQMCSRCAAEDSKRSVTYYNYLRKCTLSSRAGRNGVTHTYNFSINKFRRTFS